MSQRLKSKGTISVVFGKYILDSLSIGMYSDPLMAFREYVQNSADSIDLLPKGTPQPVVEITIDGRNRYLEIADNGVGIPSSKVKNTLLNIGASEKDPVSARGFRGIGRLGGLGYCETLVFSTKSAGERTYTTCTWDSRLLRQLMNDNKSIDTDFLIDKATSIKKTTYSGPETDHFFRVQMHNIYDSRNDLLNVPSVKSYLSQVGPVPFDPGFTYAERIERELSKNVPFYKSYPVFVNKEQIFKQYRDVVDLCRGSNDRIKGIQFVELRDGMNLLAFGWLGNLSLLGAISPASGVDGVRLRCGNILLGNKDTMSALFKETRFNHYLLGEIHTVDKRLVPNSRRDDFEDSRFKGILFNEFLREIGIPLSRKIRESSRARGKTKQQNDVKALFEEAFEVISHGYLSSRQKSRIVARLNNVNGSHALQEIQTARKLSEQVSAAQDILSAQKISRKSKAQILDLLNMVLDTTYSELPTSISVKNMFNKLSNLISYK